jgi:hypothetical protein
LKVTASRKLQMALSYGFPQRRCHEVGPSEWIK